jgi:hypothetical protein
MSDLLCTVEDDFTNQKRLSEARWLVQLSDDRVVIQDDYRPGVNPPQTWLRLAAHLEKNPGLTIRRMWLQFRSNNIKNILTEDADAYFFANSVLGIFSAKKTLSFMLVGCLHNNKLMVQRWKVPELLFMDIEERDPAQAGECLIWNGERKSVGNQAG